MEGNDYPVGLIGREPGERGGHLFQVGSLYSLPSLPERCSLLVA